MEFLDLEEGTGETGEIQNLCVMGKVFSHKASLLMVREPKKWRDAIE